MASSSHHGSDARHPGLNQQQAKKNEDDPMHSIVSPGQVEVPKAILYSWRTSVWATVILLCLYEKGYSEDEYIVKEVDITKGENFSPAYLKINESGTVPTLVVPSMDLTGTNITTKYRSLSDTIGIATFLDQARRVDTPNSIPKEPAPSFSPATVEQKILADRLIALVHAPTVDPNFIYLSAKNRSELQVKRNAHTGRLLRDRQAAMRRYLAEAVASVDVKVKLDGVGSADIERKTVRFLQDKLLANVLLGSIYAGTAGAETEEGFFEAGIKAWTIFLPECLSNVERNLVGPFALGEHVSLADLHIIAWLARVVEVCEEGQPVPAGMDSVSDKIGNGFKVGPKLRVFYDDWLKRDSFRTVYKKKLVTLMT